MSRAATDALSYFPLDTAFFQQPAMRRLVKRYGPACPALYLYVLCAAYGGKGYCVEEDGDFLEDAAIDLNCTAEAVAELLDQLVARGLLRRVPLGGATFLSSHGIQAQFQRSAKGRKRTVKVEPALWLLDGTETEDFIRPRAGTRFSWETEIPPGETGIPPGETGISPGGIGISPGETAQRKEKKNKKNQIKQNGAPDPDRAGDGLTDAGRQKLEAMRRMAAFLADKGGGTPEGAAGP